MAELMLVHKAEYKDLQRRYLGLDWPEGEESTIELSAAAKRMGVPDEEFLTDLNALRTQSRSIAEAAVFRAEFLQEKTLTGTKGLLFFAMMMGFCLVLFGILVLSVRLLTPHGPSTIQKPASEKSYSDGVEIVPQPER